VSKCPDCRRLYLGCPVGWDRSDDGLCTASADFATDCERVQNFFLIDEASKIEAEETCGICWPCEDGSGVPACTRDYSNLCPAGYITTDIAYDTYTNANGTTCIATPEYSGPCPSTLPPFESDQERAEFASRCATSWPCRTCPVEGHGVVCPQFWTHAGNGLCAAPASYKESGCPLIQDMAGWSAATRREFATRCRVRWPCTGQESAVGARDMSTPAEPVAMSDGPIAA